MPPKAPNSFWAPWAAKIIPTMTRRIKSERSTTFRSTGVIAAADIVAPQSLRLLFQTGLEHPQSLVKILGQRLFHVHQHADNVAGERRLPLHAPFHFGLVLADRFRN